MNMIYNEQTKAGARIYSTPVCEMIELGPEGSMLSTVSGSSTYGQAGRAGQDVYELDELEF